MISILVCLGVLGFVGCFIYGAVTVIHSSFQAFDAELWIEDTEALLFEEPPVPPAVGGLQARS